MISKGAWIERIQLDWQGSDSSYYIQIEDWSEALFAEPQLSSTVLQKKISELQEKIN